MNYEFIRSIDAHSPISSEFRIRTLSGALLSLFTLLLTTYLIRTEYSYNLTPRFLDHVHVMPQSPDGLEVEFDISFPHIPCALLATDANDPTGQSQSFHIDARHRVWKHRLSANGRTIGRKSKYELGNTLIHEEQLDRLQKAKDASKAVNKGDGDGTAERTLSEGEGGGAVDPEASANEEVEDEQYCGTCYGAGEEGECCNTCDDVKRVYRRRQWHIAELAAIEQCRHLVRAKDEEGEGCNVHGYVALGTGGGNLHFAPDRQWEKEGEKGKATSLLNGFFDLNSVIEMFNEGVS